MTADEYLDAILKLPKLASPLTSPDGKAVAWAWGGIHDGYDIYVTYMEHKSEPVRLTNTPQNTIPVSWMPDSQSIIVREDKDGNERYTLYQVNINEPFQIKPLTEPTPNYFIRGGELHPNGKWLIYGANVNHLTGEEVEQTWVYRHDLETDEKLVLAKPEKGAFVIPRLSPTGSHVVYERKDHHPSGRQVWLVNIDGNNDREILNFGDDAKADASWFPDGERLLIRHDTPTHKRIGIWELATESMIWLIDDPARNIEASFVPYNSDHIVVYEIENARLKSSLFHPETKSESALPSLEGNLALLAPTTDGQWVQLLQRSSTC